MGYINDVAGRNRSAATVPMFVEECCNLEPSAITSSRDLYRVWEFWSKSRGERYWLAGGRFAVELSKLGPQKFKSGIIKWRGISLTLQMREMLMKE
jgi:hypothetical protein